MNGIGIGIVGGGYMGKAHAVAMNAVGAIFAPALRPRLEMVAARSAGSSGRYRDAYGFARASDDWRVLVADPRVEAVVIASTQDTHRPIAEAALALGKPVLCEKPLGATLADSYAMAAAAEAAGVTAMCGFNYQLTPATRHALSLVHGGAIGRVTWFRGEHTEDFLADPETPANWRTRGVENGALGDLAPHPIAAMLAFMGPVERLSAQIETVHATRPGENGPEPVTNDDQGQMMLRFESGAAGHLSYSRTATGRKMGYAYEITGTKGAIRFDQEDQNALWLYRAEGPEATRGFAKILSGPAHPDYLPFCQGPGHGTGYQDQIIIEAARFLAAIAAGEPGSPSFADGLAAHRVGMAALASSDTGAWVALKDF